MRAVLFCQIFVLLICTGLLRTKIESSLALRQPFESTIKLPSARFVKFTTMGFDQLVFDLYWLNFVQYVGDDKRNVDHYDRAQNYLDLLTTLDPQFVPSYFFAAFILGSERKEPSVAEKFIDLGIAANTDNWLLPFIAGVNQYLFAHNELKAANYYRLAAKFPNAPKWLGPQAEILQAKIPSTIKEINVWDSIYNNASDSAVKERARLKLVVLWTHVYKTSPSRQISHRALTQLENLGARMPNISAPNP
ncbi:MAG: hypothetical protein JST89_16365 [Cyanobacteria bacterium SZAS-4]|nr:hypothetical protein [Cyanobacteria bacterium SZAS-4]